MLILYRNGSVAYGREEDRFYIMTGYAMSGGAYTCEMQTELPEPIVDLIGPIVGAATELQARIIRVAEEVLTPDNRRILPPRDRADLIERMEAEAEATPNPIRQVLHMLNLQNPFIAEMEKKFRRERNLPSHNCPFSTKERITFELELCERIFSELWLYYMPKEGAAEDEAQKTA